MSFWGARSASPPDPIRAIVPALRSLRILADWPRIPTNPFRLRLPKSCGGRSPFPSVPCGSLRPPSIRFWGACNGVPQLGIDNPDPNRQRWAQGTWLDGLSVLLVSCGATRVAFLRDSGSRLKFRLRAAGCVSLSAGQGGYRASLVPLPAWDAPLTVLRYSTLRPKPGRLDKLPPRSPLPLGGLS